MIRTSAQISVYPLGGKDLSPAINEALDVFRRHGMEVRPGPMSTVIEGDSGAVFSSLEDAYRLLATKNRLVVVATFSNACPPFSSPGGQR
jgi:uncharacterized protein YqgV (UPF0045/DUF77 family)